MKPFLQQILRVMPYIFWALIAIVTVLMLIEHVQKEESWRYWDKLQHIVVFVILTVAGCLAFPQKQPWVYLSLVAFGAIIEVLQGVLTTTRQPSVYDWLADVAGIFIGAGLIILLKKYSANANTR